MVGTVSELKVKVDELSDGGAKSIAFMWDKLSTDRQGKVEEWKELRNYIFSTDTTTTSNAGQWKNSTTMPKLCQIRDNLHSNYLSSIFPNDNWIRWEAYDRQAANIDTKDAITHYMSTKLKQYDFRDYISNLIYDYIDYGNCFAESIWEDGSIFQSADGVMSKRYTGPGVQRISPLDIVFDPTAPTFDKAPKIIRYIKTIGEIKKLAETDSDWDAALTKCMSFRSGAGMYSVDDYHKAMGFQVDGFSDMNEYFGSKYVEVLRFLGDYYDEETDTVQTEREIIVVDRMIMVKNNSIENTLGQGNVVQAGWRKRPDNLYAMGPLDNLVGMQYRIDHLQNLKADATDLCVHPPLVLQGDVEAFTWEPEAQIQIVGEGSITELGKNMSGVMAAQNEIAELEARMEEYAGAPKSAMGIRTPGEKTMYEVQQLQNAAGRIFQEKTVTFEIMLEKLLNGMLSEAQDNMGREQIPVLDPEFGGTKFVDITGKDIIANGLIRPVGARHFGQQAILMQNLTQTLNGPVGQMIMPHISSKNLAVLVEDLFELRRFDLVRSNVAVEEGMEREQLASAGAENQMVENQIPGT
jgi:hypothetical protein